MSISAPLPVVSVMSVLAELGFRPAHGWPGTLEFDFGGLVLTALPCQDQYLRPVVMFSALHQDARSLREINFDIPDRVESSLQVQAWIAYGIGDWFRPMRPCAWLEDGRQLQELLPWERHMRAYKDRPRALVERSWMRLAGKELRAAADEATPEHRCTLRCDGQILAFYFGERVVPLPSESGETWEYDVSIALTALRHLPMRWTREWIEVSVWQEQLRIGPMVVSLEPDDLRPKK